VGEEHSLPAETWRIGPPLGKLHRTAVVIGDDGMFMTTSHPGLCATCQHMEATETRRGSVFYRCLRARTDTSFRKYPPLPVRHCRGYQPQATEDAADTPSPETPL